LKVEKRMPLYYDIRSNFIQKINHGQFRIFSYVADQAGCANIRVIIPFILLNQLQQVKNFGFQGYFSNIFSKDIGFYKDTTVIQFQRSATQRHLELFALVKSKIKVFTRSVLVYEIDDDLFNIPEWNYASEYYKPLKQYIIKMMELADGITVSTEVLKNLYSPYNKNIVVVPNRLPKFTWGNTVCNVKETNRLKIIYPCSSNHFSIVSGITGGDIGPMLLDYIKKTTDKYEWIFIGGLPLELNDLVVSGKITRHGWLSVYEYPRFLRSLDGDIGIAPLSICNFNRAKSNIKCLEYFALGMPAVFTKIDPYKDMVLQAKDEEEFISHIEYLTDVNNRFEVWNKTKKIMGDTVFWEDNNYLNLKKFVKSYLNLMKKDVDFV